MLFNSFDREDFLKNIIDVSDIKHPALPQDYADFPEAVKQEITRIKRDSNITVRLKSLYNYQCQLCGFSISLRHGKKYAEAHHIKPLGGGHKGKDSIENIIVVCPNHHAMLDYGAMELDLNLINLSFPHIISNESVQYHNEIVCAHQNC